MSEYDIGYTDEWGWRLISRSGKVELWQNTDSGTYGVYVYEHVQRDEPWLLWSRRGSAEAATDIFGRAVDLLS